MINFKNKQKKDYYGFLIYKLTNPKGEVYIGATTNLKKRMTLYRTSISSAKNQRDLYKSIMTWGIENHKLDILFRQSANEQLNLTKINNIEQDYIYREYIKNKEKLLNIVVRGVDKKWKQ
jgi:predicted GIY-YIG superfamily endonuclease